MDAEFNGAVTLFEEFGMPRTSLTLNRHMDEAQRFAEKYTMSLLHRFHDHQAQLMDYLGFILSAENVVELAERSENVQPQPLPIVAHRLLTGYAWSEGLTRIPSLEKRHVKDLSRLAFSSVIKTFDGTSPRPTEVYTLNELLSGLESGTFALRLAHIDRESLSA